MPLILMFAGQFIFPLISIKVFKYSYTEGRY